MDVSLQIPKWKGRNKGWSLYKYEVMFDDGVKGEVKLPVLTINWAFVNYLASELCWGCMLLDLNDPVYKSQKFKDMQDRVVKGEFKYLHSLVKWKGNVNTKRKSQTR